MADIALINDLYLSFAKLVNMRTNRKVQGNVHGEFAVLQYLCYLQDGVTAGWLSEKLQLVPGRMTDILKSLEKKQYIIRQQDAEDKRRVIVSITEEGKLIATQARQEILEEYSGLVDTLGEKDTKELIRLMQIVMNYLSDKKRV